MRLDILQLLKDLRHAGDLGYHGGTMTKEGCADCVYVNRLMAAIDGIENRLIGPMPGAHDATIISSHGTVGAPPK